MNLPDLHRYLFQVEYFHESPLYGWQASVVVLESQAGAVVQQLGAAHGGGVGGADENLHEGFCGTEGL